MWSIDNEAGGKARAFARVRLTSHRVEADVDMGRTGMLTGLRFDGVADRFALVPRAAAERKFENATGDRLASDGQMAVVVLRKAAVR